MTLLSDILNSPVIVNLTNPLYWIIWYFGFKVSRWFDSKARKNNSEAELRELMNDDIYGRRNGNKKAPELIEKINNPKKNVIKDIIDKTKW